ncbi:FecR domain-containing protein [Steroidobacter sp. S1-65]|uniref:FecR domain-containing protein n=1 Tax=Steroidobacter gossypii TaxID=2805490 RepID=A0ABS1X621_9GAMM|nr:FecR domain-containing protein [Steroidobacter gossypii]MBM0108665.1 FecR domain-containing protein [Steroidobacter gossypii]
MNATPPGTVTTQAIEWHQRLKQGEMDAATRARFRAWMRSPDHVKELAHICLIDASLGGIKREGRALPKNVIDFGSFAPMARPRTAPSAPHRARLKSKVAAAASVLLAVAVGSLAALLSGDSVIVTREGSWDKRLLNDGTVVYAGPRTKLRLHFDERTRAVELLRGEALFEVARQPGRPFVVSTNAGRVQALGSAFAAAEAGDQVVVTVMKGKVAVTGHHGAQPMVPLGANQQVVLSSRRVGDPVTVNAERELKWVRNWYEYDGEQVGEIIAELNQRHGTQIVVDDPQVMPLRMSSLAFRPSRPEEFVAQINRWYADYPHKAGRRRDAVLHLQRS